MGSKKRQSDTSLTDRLFNEFYRFSFFKAVELLESLCPDKKPLGKALIPGEEPVRFSVKPDLCFPPSDISGISKADEKDKINMVTTFMGLTGPSGVLPDWYNELAIEREWHKDFSLSSFYNIFHHRLISLFYLAWKKHRFTANYEPGARDRLSGYLLSLIGLGTPELTRMIGLPEESLIFCSGLLSNRVTSALAIESAVGYLSGTTVRVKQFVERMLLLDKDDQTQIGSANSRLGMDTVCGSFVRECQTKFIIILGPMDYNNFLSFLPTGDMLAPIVSLVRYMVGVEFEFDVRIVLKKKQVPSCVLGSVTPALSQLGWSTWIKAPEFVHGDDPFITFRESEIID